MPFQIGGGDYEIHLYPGKGHMTMDNAKYLDLIGKYLSGNIEESERAALFAWAEADPANKVFLDEMIQVWSITALEEEPFETDKNVAWDRIDSRIEEPGAGNQSAKVVPLSKSFRILRIAAVILLLIIAGYWFLPFNQWTLDNPSIVYQTENEQLQVDLPDGSVVTMNKFTKLQFDSLFIDRAIVLKGEAYFQVQSDSTSPFTVISGNTKTTVLGTIFNIKAYPEDEEIKVTVEEGIVRLEQLDETADQKVLDKNQQVGYYDRGTKEVKLAEEDPAVALFWKNRRIDFVNVTLGDIFQGLEQIYDITIELENQEVKKCSASLYPVTAADPSVPLNVLAVTYGLEIVENNSTRVYKVLGSRCSRK